MEQRGYSKQQAEAMLDVIREIDVSELATKKDMQKLESGLRMEMKDLHTRIEAVKGEILRWIIPLMLGLYAAILLKPGLHL